jgi:hypothetical protein
VRGGARRTCGLAALLIASRLSLSTPLRAQDTLSRRPVLDTAATALIDSTVSRPRRNPHTALVLGLVVPGSGYLYSGQWLWAYPTFVASVGGILVGSYIYTDRCHFLGPCEPSVPIDAQLVGGAMVLAGAGIWIWSAFDAAHRVEQNEPGSALPRPGRPRPGRFIVSPVVAVPAGTMPARLGVNVAW